MKKSLFLISVWGFLFCGTCHDNHNEKKQITSDTLKSRIHQTAFSDTISPNLVGVGNSDVKDTTHKSKPKFYPVPGGPDDKVLDSLKKENDKNKKQ